MQKKIEIVILSVLGVLMPFVFGALIISNSSSVSAGESQSVKPSMAQPVGVLKAIELAGNKTVMRDAEIIDDDKAPCKILEAKFSPSQVGSGDQFIVRVKNTSPLEILSISVKVERTYDDGLKTTGLLAHHLALSIHPNDQLLHGKERVLFSRQIPLEYISHSKRPAQMSADLQRLVNRCVVKISAVIFSDGTYYGDDEVDVVRNMSALSQAQQDVGMLRAYLSNPVVTKEVMLDYLDKLNDRFKDFGFKAGKQVGPRRSNQRRARHPNQ